MGPAAMAGGTQGRGWIGAKSGFSQTKHHLGRVIDASNGHPAKRLEKSKRIVSRGTKRQGSRPRSSCLRCRGDPRGAESWPWAHARGSRSWQADVVQRNDPSGTLGQGHAIRSFHVKQVRAPGTQRMCAEHVSGGKPRASELANVLWIASWRDLLVSPAKPVAGDAHST